MKTWFAIMAALVLLGTSALAQEVPGNALWFDGSNDWVDCGYDPSLQLTGGAITLEAWIKADTWRSNIWEGSIIEKEQASPDNGYMLRCGDNGSANFNIGNNGWSEITASNVMELGRWHHLAGVYDGSMQYLYVDGQLAASRSNTNGIGATLVQLYLGSSFLYNDRTFDGMIDEVRIWNTARSQAQIQASMNDTIPSDDTPGLVAYYRFDETGGDTLHDLTTNVNFGIITNFTDTAWTASYAMVQPQSLPAAGVTDSGFTANWSAPAFGPAPIKYYIDVATDSLFDTLVSGWDQQDAGLATSAVVSGLVDGSAYYYRVNAFGGDTLGLSQHSPAIAVYTVPLRPVEQDSQINVTIGGSKAAINWADGSARRHVVFLAQDSVGSAWPSDNFTYAASTVFGSGSQIGSSGWYCVYNGDSAHSAGITVTGLNPLTSYRAVALGYNGMPGTELYLSDTTRQNLTSFTTVDALSGTVEVGAGQTYNSLTNSGGLFESISLQGLSGNLAAVITSDLDEDGSHGLTDFGSYTLTIAPDSAVLRTIAGAVDSGLIRLNGADRVTIDGRFGGEGRYLLFRNLADGGPAISMYNDAGYDTVRHCRIEGWSTSSKKKSAKKPDFSKLPPQAKADWYKNLAGSKAGASKAPYADCVVYLGGTDLTTGNHHIAFEHNIIGDRSDTALIPYELLVCDGTYGKPNSHITIDGNLFANTSYYGIDIWDGFGDGWNITNNSFYIQDTLDDWYPLGLWPSNYEPGVNAVIQDNYIGGTDSLCGGSPAIAYYEVDALDFGFTYDGHALVQGNVIQNVRCIDPSYNYLEGIYFWNGNADISGNIIGHPTDSAKGLFFSGGSSSYLWAIEANGENANIDGNIVANIHYNGGTFWGLEIVSDSGYARNNRIYACGPDSNLSSSEIVGINYEGGYGYGTYKVYNNMVSLIGNSQTPIYGIWDEGDENRMEAYYNTVYLGGSDSTEYSYAFYKDNYDTSAVVINNIFYNARTTVAGGTALNYAICVNSDSNLVSNNNLLRTAVQDTVASYDDGTTPLSLMQWRDSTGQDMNSVSVLPVFLSLNDLHLTGAQDSISNFAQPIAWITTDIDGDARNVTTPTIGCDEYFDPAGIVSDPSTMTKPLAYSLNQARPNPCKNSADISYQLAAPGLVSLKVYNLAGQLVSTLVNASQTAGLHSVRWNGKSDQGQSAANGIYIYRLAVNGFSGIGKMVVIK
ncbi:MAG: LamG-like jellyroll fold domain-containing protein [bacterium]|nr:LamG-like jellyroll fold domain-containing protein [bacterium]